MTLCKSRKSLQRVNLCKSRKSLQRVQEPSADQLYATSHHQAEGSRGPSCHLVRLVAPLGTPCGRRRGPACWHTGLASIVVTSIGLALQYGRHKYRFGAASSPWQPLCSVSREQLKGLYDSLCKSRKSLQRVNLCKSRKSLQRVQEPSADQLYATSHHQAEGSRGPSCHLVRLVAPLGTPCGRRRGPACWHTALASIVVTSPYPW